jgi:hypothetical protein
LGCIVFPSFQGIFCAFKGILEQQIPRFIRFYRPFVGISGSTKYLYAQGDPINGVDPIGWGDAVEVGEIDTYDNLTARSVVGDGIENHRLLPKSIACLFEVSAGKMLAIALLPGPHQAYDNAWNNWFREIGAQGQRCNEQIVTIEMVLETAAQIYKANPEIIDAINNWVSGLAQYGLP